MGMAALVTGGAVGVGYAIATRLALAGYDIAIADVDAAGPDEAAYMTGQAISVTGGLWVH